MSQRFFKGRTNNHLTFMMVDSTDFATPESAMSAATKIKIYGKLRSATGVNFVSSGAGSLTNDIVHVGASVLGLYTIALAKADLSDASAAWYDQYIISLSATGAAYQALVVEGVIDESTLMSRVLLTQSAASDAASAATQANSRVLVVQSQASDAYSAIIAPLASMTSDIASAVWAHAVGTRVDSRILVAQSFLSDIRSQITLGVPLDASTISDIRSAITAGPTPTITASDMSDIASRVWATAIGARVDSRILVIQSQASDAYSAIIAPLASMTSDIASAVWAHAVGTRVDSRVLVNQSYLSDIRSQLTAGLPMTASDMSDLRSAITAGPTPTITASDMSDIASRVWATAEGARVDSRIRLLQSTASDAASAAQQANSRVLLNLSHLSDIDSFLLIMSGVQSDIYSLLSDFQSDFQSRVPKRVATDSQLSDALSDIKSAIAGLTVTVTASDMSDIASRVWATTEGARVDSRIRLLQSTASDAASAAQQANSRVLITQSQASDVYSLITAGVPLDASTISDLRSAIAGVTATLTASDMSDIASRVWATTEGVRVDSRILVAQSYLSDIRSHVSDLQSDFQSRVPKLVATNSQLSDLTSDLRSYLAVMSGVESDIYSLLSDVQSDFQSRVPKRVATDSQLSDMASDLKSAIAGFTATLTASDMSDIASRVWATAEGTRVDSRLLVAQSYLSDIRSHVSDLQSDFQSRVPKRVATDSQLSDLSSDLKSAIAGFTATLTASDMSDIASRVWAEAAATTLTSRVLVNQSAVSDLASYLAVMSGILSDVYSGIVVGNSRVLVAQSGASDAASAAQQANSRALVIQSMTSDLQSKLSDVESNLLSFLATTGVQLNTSVMSDLRSAVAGITFSLSASDISDIASAVLAGAGTTTISASDMSDIASRVWAEAAATTLTSRMLVAKSSLSDIYSLLSDVQSDFQSRVPKLVATSSQVSDLSSDIKSAVLLTQSLASDAHSAAAQANSRVVVVQSLASDLYSLVSDLQSDFQSRIPKLVATNSQVSDLASDVKSAVLLVQSLVSDVYSLVSDLQSDFQSRVPKRVATDSQLSDLASDLKSAMGAATFTLGASDLSDIGSAVWANAIGARVDSRLLVVKSHASDIYSLITAGVELGTSTMSDLRSAITGTAFTLSASDISDIGSAVWNNPIGARVDSRLRLVQSDVSDTNSLLTDFQSDFQSRVPKRVATDSQLSDLHSDLRSFAIEQQSMASDIYSLVLGGVDLSSSSMSDIRSLIDARLPAGIQKNQAFPNFEFEMVLASDHITGATGLTVTAIRSIDGGFYGPCANAVVEVGSGTYKITLAATDLNGDFVTLKFSAPTANDTTISLRPAP